MVLIADVRIMDRLSIPGETSTKLVSNAKDNKRKRKSDSQATEKERGAASAHL